MLRVLGPSTSHSRMHILQQNGLFLSTMVDLETLLSDKGAWPSIQGSLHGKERIDLLKAIEGKSNRPDPDCYRDNTSIQGDAVCCSLGLLVLN